MPEQITLTRKMKDLTGQRFGSLVAIQPVQRSPERNIIWKFQCDCGSLYEGAGCWVVQQRKFATNPKAPSCGCLNKETTRELRLTHGMSKHPLFWVWSAMVERCHNPKAADYHKYGEKGVYVCPEWRNSSSSFLNGHWPMDGRKGCTSTKIFFVTNKDCHPTTALKRANLLAYLRTADPLKNGSSKTNQTEIKETTNVITRKSRNRRIDCQ